MKVNPGGLLRTREMGTIKLSQPAKVFLIVAAGSRLALDSPEYLWSWARLSGYLSQT